MNIFKNARQMNYNRQSSNSFGLIAQKLFYAAADFRTTFTDFYK